MRKSGSRTWGWGLGIRLGLSSLLACGSLSFAQEPFTVAPERELRITIWLYNHAQVPDSILVRAKQQAGRVLRKTGVEVEWLHCRRSAAEPPVHHGCNKPFGPADIALRVVPRSTAAHFDSRRESLGFALPSVGSAHGVDAWVFYHRVEELAKSALAPRYVVLGHAIAHEVGHLLLGANQHYPRGIMSPDWSPEDLKLAAWGMLLFTREQAERIRAEVLARTKAQATAASRPN